MTNPIEDPNRMFSVTVETKNLLKFLAAYQIADTTIFCTLLRTLLQVC
jgi:hypothetical protein